MSPRSRVLQISRVVKNLCPLPEHMALECHLSTRSKITFGIELVVKKPNSVAPIHHPNPQLEMTSNACNTGWGAHFNGVSANGHFSPAELPLSINTKETLAIRHGFHGFKEHFKNKHILLKSDSTIAISYIKKFGGIQSELRSKISLDLWCLATSQNTWLSMCHVPGVLNTESDIASHFLSVRTEWHLDPTIFKLCCKVLNMNPEIDLFASRLNKQLKRYYSYDPDSFTEHMDSFTIFWQSTVSYLYCPFSCLSRAMNKIHQNKARVIVIVPCWSGQPWFTTMLELLANFPWTLSMDRPYILTLPFASNMTYPNLKNLNLLSLMHMSCTCMATSVAMVICACSPRLMESLCRGSP